MENSKGPGPRMILASTVVVSIFMNFAPSANAASLEELRKLEDNFCAASARESLGLSSPKPLGGPRKFEADGGCVECDVKAALAPSKLANVEASVAELTRPILEAIERDQAKRDLAFFKYLGKPVKPVEGSLDQLKSSLDENKTRLVQEQSKLEKKDRSFEAAKNVLSAFRAFKGGKPSGAVVGAEDRGAFFKPQFEYFESLRAATEERLASTEAQITKATDAGELKSAQIYQNYKTMYQEQMAETSDQANLFRRLESLMKDASGGEPLSGEQMSYLRGALEERLADLESAFKAQEVDVREVKNRIFGLEKKISVLESKKFPPKSKEESDLADYEAHYSSLVTSGLSGPNGGLPCGLSVAEVYAINHYTSSGFMDLNPAIRKGGKSRENTKPFEDVLNAALTKIRAYEGSVIRGGNLPPKVLAEHQVGEIVNYSAFTSTSLAAGFSGSHQFVIKSKKGRFIGPLSVHRGEEEVLFGSDTKFRILSREDIGSGIRFVLEEVDGER